MGTVSPAGTPKVGPIGAGAPQMSRGGPTDCGKNAVAEPLVDSGSSQGWPGRRAAIRPAMSDPVHILAGASWFITSRCIERRYLFVPSEKVSQLIRYCLAQSAAEYGVLLHGATFMSSHAHLVVTDPRGVLPDFLQAFHGTLARALNAHHRRSGSVFGRNNVHYERLGGEAAFVTALAYTASNPVSAFAVEFGRDWPGLRTQAKDMGHEGDELRRPGHFFRHRSGEYRGDLPDKVTLRCELPPCVSPDRRGAFIHAVERAIGAAEADARADAKAKGARFMGAAACRRMSPDHRATSPEPHGPGTGPSRVLADDDVTRQALDAEYEGFLEAYRAARHAWEAGDREVVFPEGSWLIVRRHRACCAAAAGPPRVV
jgi:putative transposase